MPEWKITSTTNMLKGDNPLGNRFYGYRQVQLELPDGRPANYHGVLVGPCVHVVAVEGDLTTYLVSQPRPNAITPKDTSVPRTLELPGGFAHGDLREVAQNELNEETGLRAGSLKSIGSQRPYPQISDEVDTIFLAHDLSRIDGDGIESGEATEQDLRVIPIRFGLLYDQIRRYPERVAAPMVSAIAMASVHLGY